MMKNAFVIVLAVLAMAALPDTVYAITTGSCSDGTPYNGCSSVSPGYWCHGSINSPTLDVLLTVCPCSKTAGWMEQSGACVKANCNDGTQAGQCSITKPKQCVNGVLMDNATACHCPSGYQIDANKITCSAIPCNVSGTPVVSGQCYKGQLCQSGQMVDKASQCPCISPAVAQGEKCVVFCTDSGANKIAVGSCSAVDYKQCILSGTGTGVLLANATACGCPSGQTANGAYCTASVAGALGGAADILGGAQAGNNSSGASVTGSANALSCCCLPTAMIGIVGGFVAFRKGGE